MLDFINEDETRGAVRWKACADFLAEGDCIAAEKKVIGFKVDFYDMIRGNTTVKQMALEEIEEKKALPTTSHSNQNLYKIVFFALISLFRRISLFMIIVLALL